MSEMLSWGCVPEGPGQGYVEQGEDGAVLAPGHWLWGPGRVALGFIVRFICLLLRSGFPQ